MFYVYILESIEKGEFYTGFAVDLKKRLEEHNHKLNFSTKSGAPWRVIYYEACLDKQDALRREKYLKTSQGMRLIKRRLKEYFFNRKNKK
ncbi:MAG: GIY-YIG nuclease family protein [bacterium]